MNSLLILAIRELGHKSSIKSNPELSGYYQALKKSSSSSIDHSLWSCAFINWIADKAGFKHLNYSSPSEWLTLRKEVDSEPEAGDLVIYETFINGIPIIFTSLFVWRSTNNAIAYCLGGDENHEVSVKAISAKNILGFRRLGHMMKESTV
jgi:hypothetical protein